MTTQQNNTIENQNTLEQHLNAEIKRCETSAKRGGLFFAALTLVVFGYMGWLNGTFDEVFEPGNLAEVTLSQAKAALPSAQAAIEREILESVPKLTDVAMDTAIEQAVPQMRIAAEKAFFRYAREMATQGVSASVDAFEQIVRSHRSALSARSTSGPGIFTSEAFIAELDDGLALTLNERLTDSPRESVRTKLDHAAVALRNINSRLGELASGERLSRKDELSRQLITAWWGMVSQQGGVDSTVEQIQGRQPMYRDELGG